MSDLKDPLDQHRTQVVDSLAAAPGLSALLARYLKEAYDRTVRGLMSSPPVQRGFSSSDDRRSDPGVRDYTHLRSGSPAPLVADESSRRARVADIPLGREEHGAWAASSDGQAWQRHVESTMPSDIKAALASPESEQRLLRTDDMREQLRVEVLERRGQGDPMTVGEYEDRYSQGVVDVARQLHEGRSDPREAQARDRDVDFTLFVLWRPRPSGRGGNGTATPVACADGSPRSGRSGTASFLFPGCAG